MNLIAILALALTLMSLALLRPASWTGAPSPVRVLGWLLLAGGLATFALLALALFTGRFGPEHFWFREPAFYLALTVLVAALVVWLRRPSRPWQRFGIPFAAVLALLLVIVASRLDGRSMPLAMSMPTLRAEAPELRYVDESGRSHRLADLRGRVVLLNFWATWCTPCRREMPLLARMQREHAEEGLVVLYLSLEEPEVLAPFLAANRYEGLHGRLELAAHYYGAGRFYPLSFLITREGRVAYRWSGRPREEWLVARIEELLRP